jgi:hypothetical protein
MLSVNHDQVYTEEFFNLLRMKRMNRMPTRKSHSWWWDSHISPKNNKWLAENLEGNNSVVYGMAVCTKILMLFSRQSNVQ